MPLVSSQASQPRLPTQRLSGADHSSPAPIAQLHSIDANPPSVRYWGMARTISSQMASPRRPLSRNTNRDSGEMTYGGLEKIRSKRLPATGSNRLPRRH